MRRFLCLILCVLCLCPQVHAAGERKYVALTFDDGPSGRFTRRLLEGLEKRDVKATFLLCGYRLEQYPALAGKILAQGHEIGLHGYSHGNMANMSAAVLREELRKTRALLPKGSQLAFLRPPGGSSSRVLEEVTREQGLAILNWSVDPRDWAVHDAAQVEAAVVEQIRDGDVILLHDMCDCSVDAALNIVDKLTKEGFRFVTVSELARRKGVTVTPGRVYSRFG